MQQVAPILRATYESPRPDFDAVLNTEHIPILVQVLRAHTADPVVCTAVCFTLWHACRNGANRGRLLEEGGAAVLINAASEHMLNPEAVLAISRAITNMCLPDSQRGMELLVNMLKTHMADSQLVQAICNAICNALNAVKNMQYLGMVGGVHVLLSAIKEHMSNPAMLVQACAAVHNAAKHDENQRKLGEFGGIPLLLQLCQQHMANQILVEFSCGALGNICCGSETNKIALGAAGGFEVLLQVIQQHMEVASTVEKAVIALANAIHDQNQPILQRLGAGDVVKRAIRAHASVASNEWVPKVLSLLGGGSVTLSVGVKTKEKRDKTLDACKTGIMVKDGGSIKTWKERFFILKWKGILKYYKPPGTSKKMGQVDLRNLQPGNVAIDERARHQLKICTPGREYHMRTKSDEERDGWITALRSVIEKLRGSGSTAAEH